MSDPRTISLISIAANDIPIDFPEAALEEAEKAKAAPMGQRLDLRSVPLVTIDGEDARDFDDAVFAEPDPAHPGGWRILVAIADVAWYVRHDRPLDRAAYRRGTSVYFPDRVVPMLPEQLSNHWCSLVPHEDRPVLVAEMWIDAEGHLQRHKFHRAMMRSAARLTYNRVQRAMDGTPDDEIEPLMDAVVRPLYGAYRVLLAARDARGALDLDLPERQVALGKDGHIARDRRARAPRQPQADRGIHGAGQRGGGPGAGAAPRALPLPRPRPARPRQARGAARVPRARLGLRVPTGQRLRPADLNRILHQVADKPVVAARQPDGPAQPEPGRLQPRQSRPFRPGPRPLRPLHLADPPLPRPDRPPRPDRRLRAGRRRPRGRRQGPLHRIRRAPLDVRAPSRRRRARRHGPLRRGLHGGPCRRHLPRHGSPASPASACSPPSTAPAPTG